jgi:hypothetical protein
MNFGKFKESHADESRSAHAKHMVDILSPAKGEYSSNTKRPRFHRICLDPGDTIEYGCLRLCAPLIMCNSGL